MITNSLSSVLVANTAAIVAALPGVQSSEVPNLIDSVGGRLLALARSGHAIEVGSAGHTQVVHEIQNDTVVEAGTDTTKQPLVVTQEVAPVLQEKPVPMVDPAISITPDKLICLEDGMHLKVLTRHIMAKFNLTPDQYRARWGLPDNYPMAAPNYSKHRREISLRMGFGHRKTGTAMSGNKPGTSTAGTAGTSRVKRQYRKKAA